MADNRTRIEIEQDELAIELDRNGYDARDLSGVIARAEQEDRDRKRHTGR